MTTRLAAAFLGTLVLAGCSDSGSTSDDAAGSTSSSEDSPASEDATFNDADVTFVQMMIPHHRAGVTMAEAAVKNAGEAKVRQLAESIVTSQSAELKVLRSMLSARGGELPST